MKKVPQVTVMPDPHFHIISPTAVVVFRVGIKSDRTIVIPTEHEPQDIKTCLVVSNGVLHVAASASFTGSALVVDVPSLSTATSVVAASTASDCKAYTLHEVDDVYVVVQGSMPSVEPHPPKYWKSDGWFGGWDPSENIAAFEAFGKCPEIIRHSALVLTENGFYNGRLQIELDTKMCVVWDN